MEKLPLVAEGPIIFEIWQQTLLFWLSSRHNIIYLVTPFLDEYILKEFLYIVKKKNATAKIGKIFIREKCAEEWDPEKEMKRKVTFNEIEEKIKKECRTHDKDLLAVFTEKVLPNIFQIKTNYFHAKFIACVNTKTDEAEVLLTSANFNETHFCEWKNGQCNRDSLGYHHGISRDDFEENLISPIELLQKKTRT